MLGIAQRLTLDSKACDIIIARLRHLRWAAPAAGVISNGWTFTFDLKEHDYGNRQEGLRQAGQESCTRKIQQ